jgi:hypothetical protein
VYRIRSSQRPRQSRDFKRLRTFRLYLSGSLTPTVFETTTIARFWHIRPQLTGLLLDSDRTSTYGLNQKAKRRIKEASQTH